LLNFSIAVSRLSEQTSRLAQRLAMLEEQVRRSGEHQGPD
jgi:predicted ATP-grasp superfamily ATP-dependent carboligase